MKSLICFLSLLFVFIVAVNGQNPSQTRISGIVSDQNNAVIVGARVFLLNSNTRMEKFTSTNSSGVFTFDRVDPGNYEIRVAADGFATQVTPVQVTAAGISNLEIALTIGASNTTVTAEVGRSE